MHSNSRSGWSGVAFQKSRGVSHVSSQPLDDSYKLRVSGSDLLQRAVAAARRARWACELRAAPCYGCFRSPSQWRLRHAYDIMREIVFTLRPRRGWSRDATARTGGNQHAALVPRRSSARAGRRAGRDSNSTTIAGQVVRDLLPRKFPSSEHHGGLERCTRSHRRNSSQLAAFRLHERAARTDRVLRRMTTFVAPPVSHLTAVCRHSCAPRAVDVGGCRAPRKGTPPPGASAARARALIQPWIRAPSCARQR